MLLRLIVENVLSFKDPTEINTFTGSIKNKAHHKQTFKNIESLKVSAIYGANGAGKSNIVEILNFLKETISSGKLEYHLKPFRLDKKYCNERNSKIDIEFIAKNICFYYELTYKNHQILKEVLWKNSHEKNAIKIFERKPSNKKNQTTIVVNEDYAKNEKDKLRIKILEEDVVTPLHTVISNKILRKAIKEIDIAFNWINSDLIIISPTSRFKPLIGNLLFDKKFSNYMNETMSALDTGIKSIEIKESSLESYFGEDEKDEVEKIKNQLDEEEDLYANIETDDGDFIVRKKDEKYVVNSIALLHKEKTDKSELSEQFEILEESEGTQRLFDLIPMTYSLLSENKTYVVDEIERSIHPVLIRELFVKLLEGKIKGQILFTTHESSLLDLEIFRQDEIWLAEKNPEGATKLFPLSNYKPRFDLDIRKGYLSGRFGAIPFLGNLKELKWDSAYEKK